MNKTSFLASALFATTLLAGCGGSSDPDDINGGPDDGGGTPSAGYLEYQAEADELVVLLETLDVTPSAALPTSGTANYRGLAAFYVDGNSDNDDPTAISRTNFAANFATAEITGTFSDFEDSEGATITGSLSMTGRIDTSGNDSAFTGAITGSLDAPGGNIDVSANVSNGHFQGGDGQALSGLFSGTINDAGDTLPLTGEFGAERQ